MSNRILMLLENSPYPEDNRVRSEAQTLTKAGYHVTIIAPTWTDEPRCQLVNDVLVYRYRGMPEKPGLLGYLLEYSYALIATFFISLYIWLRHGFDVIHSHNPPDLFVFIALFFKPFKKKFVFDHHDLSPEVYQARTSTGGNLLVHKVLLKLEALSLRCADYVIATNESYKQIEMERGQVPEERIAVVRNAPDAAHLREVEPDPELRGKAGTILCYVGEMAYQDGLDYLLRSLSILLKDLKQSDFYCILLGRGPELENLKQLAIDLGLKDHVWFFGWANGEQLSRVLSSSDICVDPDPANPFNDRSTMIKMTEYMALGKPIVAFDLTEHRFTAQEAALYVADNSEEGFAQAIHKLMGDPELRQKMGEIGRKRIETTLSWQHSTTNLINMYSKLLPLSPKKNTSAIRNKRASAATTGAQNPRLTKVP